MNASWIWYHDVWRVLVPPPGAKLGDTVEVFKKSGEKSSEKLGSVVGTLGKGTIFAVQPKAKPVVSNRPSRTARADWQPCGYPGCNSSYCDECDGRGYRGYGR